EPGVELGVLRGAAARAEVLLRLTQLRVRADERGASLERLAHQAVERRRLEQRPPLRRDVLARRQSFLGDGGGRVLRCCWTLRDANRIVRACRPPDESDEGETPFRSLVHFNPASSDRRSPRKP